MYTSQHIFFGAIFSIFLFFLFPEMGWLMAIIIFASSVLIDVDHYTYHVYKKKDWSLRNAYNWHIKNLKKFLSLPKKQREKVYGCVYALHGIEIVLLALLGSFLSKIFFFIAIGVSFHLILDIVDATKYFDRLDKFSLIHDFLKFKKLKNIDDAL